MTTRRTIRIEVTDFGEDGPGFDGPRAREHATLVREFAVDPVLDKSPADLVGALAEWLDGQPRRSQHCDFQLVDHLGPPRACVLPPGHKGKHYGIGGDQQCDEYITSDRRCSDRIKIVNETHRLRPKPRVGSVWERRGIRYVVGTNSEGHHQLVNLADGYIAAVGLIYTLPEMWREVPIEELEREAQRGKHDIGGDS